MITIINILNNKVHSPLITSIVTKVTISWLKLQVVTIMFSLKIMVLQYHFIIITQSCIYSQTKTNK